jgi:anaerobic ribonucleoside-triphosphate reductase activating protein
MRSTDSTMTINVADWDGCSISNGPGNRFVLWLQGCPFRCFGCSNPDFLEFRVATEMSVSAVRSLAFAHSQIEGITLSGGEPMSQAEALSALLPDLRHAGLSVVCFSGYTLDEILAAADPWQQQLLSLIDVLIDGRYNAKVPGAGIRGSANQQVHFLTDRYSPQNTAMMDAKTIELKSLRESVTVTGVFETELFNRLQQKMQNGPRQIVQIEE